MKTLLSALLILSLLAPLAILAGAEGEGGTTMSPGPMQAGEEKGLSPGAPTGLRLVIEQGGFLLTWELSPHDPEMVTGYEIVRAANIAGGPYEPVATVGSGVNQYADTTASPENIYFYKVRAVAGSTSSLFSNTVSGEIPGSPGR